ncbi:hypothetical protein HED60_12180 [Planctomycetales bacterium ZRK34]|nr:hypothetical protein HED60_12180 [Planctomycetales bacterium ZRK34]
MSAPDSGNRFPSPSRRPLKMRLREYADRHSNVLTGVAVMIAVIGLAVAVTFSPSKDTQNTASPPRPGVAFYYDTVTGAYFVDSATLIAPIVSPAGNVAVRAHFFSCSDCEETTRFLGYYEKYEPKVKKRLEKNPEAYEFFEEAFQGRLYSEDGITWVGAESEDGYKIIEALQDRCPAKRLRYCPPN